MIPMHIQANFVPESHTFKIVFTVYDEKDKPKTFINEYAPEEFATVANNFPQNMKIGGFDFKFDDKSGESIAVMKNYLLMVWESYCNSPDW